MTLLQTILYTKIKHEIPAENTALYIKNLKLNGLASVKMICDIRGKIMPQGVFKKFAYPAR